VVGLQVEVVVEVHGKDRKYFPDFYFSSLNLIIEIKSTYIYNLQKEKNDLKKESVLNNNYNYILILDKNYDEFKIKYLNEINKS